MDESERGRFPQWEEDVGLEVGERLARFARTADEAAGAGIRGPDDPGPGGANGNGGPRKVDRHPEDPVNALPDAGQEVADPERIRVKAAKLGITSQAVAPDYFEWLTRPLYRAVHDVRSGAVVMPGQREAGDRLKFAARTGADAEKILADGVADAAKASRFGEEVIPRTKQELESAKEEVAAASERLDRSRRRVEELRESDDENGITAGGARSRARSGSRFAIEARGGLFGRLSLTPRKALLVFIVEILGTTLILSAGVSDALEQPRGISAAIAAGVSVTLLVASFVAAIALAAIRMPGRVVGLLALGVYVAILYKFVPGIEELRAAEGSGQTAMVTATLTACFVAGFTGYVTAVGDDRREEHDARELRREASTPLGHALVELREAEEEHERAQRRCAAHEHELSRLFGEVEELHDASERSKAVAEERVAAGVEAEAEAATLEALSNAGVDQELAAGRWATLIALLAHEKTRLETMPDEGEPLRVSATGPGSGRAGGGDGLSGMQKGALGVLGVSGLGSFLVGVVSLGVGVPLAVALVLLDQGRRLTRAQGGGEGEGERRTEATPLVSPASDDNQFYIHQPERMVPKYEDGGSTPGEKQ